MCHFSCCCKANMQRGRDGFPEPADQLQTVILKADLQVLVLWNSESMVTTFLGKTEQPPSPCLLTLRGLSLLKNLTDIKAAVCPSPFISLPFHFLSVWPSPLWLYLSHLSLIIHCGFPDLSRCWQICYCSNALYSSCLINGLSSSQCTPSAPCCYGYTSVLKVGLRHLLVSHLQSQVCVWTPDFFCAHRRDS